MSKIITVILSIFGVLVIILIGSYFYYDNLSILTSSETGNTSPIVSNTSGNISIIATSNTSGNISIIVSDVDKEVEKLRKANIAFNSPSKMKKGDTYLITLFLSPNQSSKELLKKINDIEKESATIKYSNRMRADLISENKKAFEITPISPDVQAISTIINTTTWKWDVTALEAGKQYLHLTLTAFLDVEGKDTPLQIKTFDKRIKVEISILEEIAIFIEKSWQWILGSLLFPLVVWYWKLRHPNKEKANK